MSSVVPSFEEWYPKNKSYYAAKHDNNEDAMRRDALNAHNTIRIVAGRPPAEPKKTGKKKKPNPYGFD